MCIVISVVRWLNKIKLLRVVGLVKESFRGNDKFIIHVQFRNNPFFKLEMLENPC